MTMARRTNASPVARVLLLVSLAALLVPWTSASGCHGISNFRLAPVSKGAATQIDKELQGQLDVNEKMASCQEEFGMDATMMDLELMEGEFPKVEDLQHALNPLFDVDPNAVYYVLDHQQDIAAGVNNIDMKYVLAKETNETIVTRHDTPTRVAGQVYLEVRSILDDLALLDNVHILCYIPKPKYTLMGSSYMIMEDNDSSTNWTVIITGMVFVAALGLAAFKTYQVRMGETSSPFDRRRSAGPMGGSYSMLSSSGDNDLSQYLAPSLELA